MRFTDHINVYKLFLLKRGNFEDEDNTEKIKELIDLPANKLNRVWKANTIFEDRFSIKNLTIFIQMWETIKYKIDHDEDIFTSDLYMEVDNSNKILYIIDHSYSYFKFKIGDTPSTNKNYIPLDDIPITVDKEYREF